MYSTREYQRLDRAEVRQLLHRTRGLMRPDHHRIGGRSYLAARVRARRWCQCWCAGWSFTAIGRDLVDPAVTRQHVRTIVGRYIDWMRQQSEPPNPVVP